jgi:AcrR family transcriptional regulator
MNESTRVRLIQAARRLFAQHGYDATSVRAITRAAGANLGAITYHFGSKAALYEAVLAEAFVPVSSRAARSGQVTDPIGAIEQLVAGVFQEIAANPDMQLLILQQVVQKKAMPEQAQKGLGSVLAAIAAQVERGQRAGTIRQGDAVLMAVSVMAQPAYFSLVRRFAPKRLVLGRRKSPDLEDLVRHVQQFVRAALSAETADGGMRR